MSNPIDLCLLSDVRLWLGLEATGQSITSVSLTNGGTGYSGPTFPVTITSVDGNGSGASITANVTGGVVTSLTIAPNVSGSPGIGTGTGFTNPPVLSFAAGGGTGASAVAYIGEDLILSRLITAASGLILKYTGRPSFTSQSFVETRNGNGAPRMTTIQYPIISVASVQVNGLTVQQSTAPGLSGWAYDLYTIYLVGCLNYWPGIWIGQNVGVFLRGLQNVVLTYTAGYATIPYDITQACIELVAQKQVRKSHVDQVSASMSQMQTITYSQKDIPPEVKTTLDRYRYITPYYS
jgi:hypothetical protein